MEILKSPGEMTAWAKEQVQQGKRTALVPTMGYFHEGHLSLMRMAGNHADQVIVSLFVNPIQFGPGEDLDSYPNSFARDSELAENEGVSILFAPKAEDMYPAGFQTTVSVDQLSNDFCGVDRPGHFTGVTTVVSKLFHIIQPDYAVFGAKDFQQLAIIRRMVLDLNMNVEILAHPIVREEDGLAMSSRNTYLNDNQRKSALALSKGIALARSLFQQGERDTAVLGAKVNELISSFTGTGIDYVGFIDQNNLAPVSTADTDTRIVMAVTIDNRVRLIDNGLVTPEAG